MTVFLQFSSFWFAKFVATTYIVTHGQTWGNHQTSRQAICLDWFFILNICMQPSYFV